MKKQNRETSLTIKGKASKSNMFGNAKKAFSFVLENEWCNGSTATYDKGAESVQVAIRKAPPKSEAALCIVAEVGGAPSVKMGYLYKGGIGHARIYDDEKRQWGKWKKTQEHRAIAKVGGAAIERRKAVPAPCSFDNGDHPGRQTPKQETIRAVKS